MKNASKLISHILMGLLLSLVFMSAALASDIPNQTRAALQMTLLEHIEMNSDTRDYAYRHFDAKAGEPVFFQFTKLHPMIIERDDVFVLCADFRDRNNNKVEIDFILVPAINGYLVTQSIINNRKTVMRYFRSGLE